MSLTLIFILDYLAHFTPVYPLDWVLFQNIHKLFCPPSKILRISFPKYYHLGPIEPNIYGFSRFLLVCFKFGLQIPNAAFIY